MISKEAIKQFQGIYFKEFGVMLNFDEAAAQAEHFLRFFMAVVKPPNKGLQSDYPSAAS